jgi:outer membrane protein, heavy metal efflux system
MCMGTKAAVVCAVVCLHASLAAAQRTLTLPDVLARAREHAPHVVSARLALEETRARVAGASMRFQTNPDVDVWVGNRSASDGRFTDLEVGVGQTFEPAGRRAARMAGAEAAVAQGAAQVDDVTRAVLRAAATAYYRVLHAQERIRLLGAAHDLANGLHASADRRYKAGDVALLDVNIARASAARVRAEREAAEASKAAALGDLKQLTQLEGDVIVTEPLARPSETSLDVALRAAEQRPELRALEAGIREAESELRLGMSLAKPELGAAVRYAREEGDQIVLGGFTVTLPMFSKGQEQRAAGSARAARLRTELDAARTRIRAEVRAAYDAFAHRLAAVRVLEADAVPSLDENEALATRSFDVGQLGLPEVLLIRREILETRMQFVDALLEAALARVDLDASAGVLPGVKP